MTKCFKLAQINVCLDSSKSLLDFHVGTQLGKIACTELELLYNLIAVSDRTVCAFFFPDARVIRRGVL